MCMKKLIFVFALVLGCMSSYAGDYTIEMEPSKQIIYLSRLGLPPDTTLETLLKTMPELMHRGDILFDNYDIQCDGKSVGESRDVILLQTRVDELEKIEVTSSSVATQSRNGQSGTINIVYKTPSDGFGGDVNVSASTEVDLIPSVNVNYANNKLELRGHASFEYYHPEKQTIYENVLPLKTITGYNTNTEKYLQETARLNLKYKFDKSNTLKAWLLETFNNSDNNQYKDITTVYDRSAEYGKGWYYSEHQYDTLLNHSRMLNVSAKAEYEHLFRPDAKFVVFAGYETSNKKDNNAFSYPNTLDGEVKYEGVVWSNEDHMVKIKPGVNVSYQDKRFQDNTSRSLYLSPYFDFNYKYKGLWVNGTGRYQRYNRSNRVDGYDGFNAAENDFVWNANVQWQVRPHHALRFSSSRNIIRPADNMLYPGFVYYPSTRKWMYGNPDLRRSSVYEFELGYITDCHWGARSLVVQAKAGYDHATDLIEEMVRTILYQESFPMVYSTYTNSGEKNIAKMNVSALYKSDLLTLSAAGNLFCNFENMSGGADKHLYYNVSVSSILNLENNWAVSADVQYNSSIVTEHCVYGDRLLANARLYKSFGRLAASLEIFDIFDYLTTDYTEQKDSKFSSLYDLYGRWIGMSLTYKFGVR